MAGEGDPKKGSLFSDEDAVSKLEALVYNSLSLGQWESARGHLISLAHHENGRRTVKEILRSIVLNPKGVWSESKSIPSDNHLILLALQAHAELCHDDTEGIPSAIQRQHQFKLLLHSCSTCEGYTPQISEWLYGYYITHCVGSTPHSLTPLHTFHHTIQKFLLSVLQSDPSVAHVLISYLTVESRPHYLANNELLQSLYIDCIDIYWKKLEKRAHKASTSNDPKLQSSIVGLAEKIHHLLSLIDPQSDMSRFLNRLDNTLVKLIQLDFVSSSGERLFTYSSVYSCFLGRSSPMLIQRFQDTEEYLKGYRRRQQWEELPVREEASSEGRWEAELYKALRESQHFLERIMVACLKAISSGSMDKLAELISDPVYSCIKPLLLLLGWDRYPDVGSGQKLLDILWPEAQKAEPLLLSGCCKLAFQVGLVQWCLQKAKPFLPATSTPVTSSAGDVFQGLKNHSILYVLHHSTPLSSLDPHEVIDILKLRPDSSLSVPLGVPVSPPSDLVASPKAHSSMTPEQERDINTFRGFCSLKLIMEGVWYSVLISNGIHSFTSSGASEPKSGEGGQAAKTKPRASRKLDLGQTEEMTDSEAVSSPSATNNSLYATEVTQRLEEAKAHISAIFPLNFRLEVLEDIFSLLFLSSEDIQSLEEGPGSHEGSETFASLQNSSGSPGVSEGGSFSYSHSVTFIRKQHGFLLDERTARDILLLLNDSIFELSAAKFSMLSAPGKPMGSGFQPGKEILSSIAPSLLQQRFGKLQKDVNEAKWRLELVSSKTGLSSISSVSRSESFSSYESSRSEASDQEDDDLDQLKKEPEMKLMHRGWGQDEASRKSPSTGFKQSLPLLAREGSHEARKSDEAGSSKKPSSERYARQSPSADEIYESSGHCADIEEGSPLPLSKKKKVRSHVSLELKLRKIKSQPIQKGSGIIYQMLASPKSLLCKCLRHGNYLKAHEVVKMFAMENEVADSLVKFSEQLKEVRQELVGHSQGSAHPVPVLSPKKQVMVNGNSGLQVAILNATDSSSTLDSLHRLVLPKVLHKMLFAGNEDLDTSHKDVPLLSSLEENVPSLVMLDLLISSEVDGHTSKRIVNMAVERSSVVLECLSPKLSDNLLSGRRSFQERRSLSFLDKPLQGPLSLLHTLSEVSGYFLLSLPLAAPFPLSCRPIISPFCLLTQFLFPIRVDLIQYWRDFSESYGEKRDAVEGVVQKSFFNADILDVLSRKESTKGIEHIFAELSQAMKSLPQDGEVVKSDCPDHSIQYLLHVHGYLSKLVHLLRNSLGLSSSQVSPSQMLSVLHESPTELIGRLVFEKNISPQRLEQFMSDLPHLKIVEVIVKCCCPFIPNDSQRLKLSPFANNRIHPLNESNGEEGVSTNGDEDDPCLLSHKLLGKMITTLKGLCQTEGGKIKAQDLKNAYKMTEMKKVLSCTVKLATISLSSLRDDPNRQIAFFSNVTNLLYCHAIMYIIHISEEISATGLSLNALQSDKLAKIAYFSRVGYFIGEAGLVSLYDLHYSILRQNLSLPILDKEHKVKLQPLRTLYEPWKEYAPSQPDPRVLYVISTGTLGSPTPRLLQPDHVHSDLESAEFKFLRATISFDVQKCTVRIPKLLDDHRNDFISRKSRYDPDNPYRHLSNVALLKYIKGRLLKEQEEQLSQLLDMCDTTSKRKMANELKLEVVEEDYTLGYDFPRRIEGHSPQLQRRDSTPKKSLRRYTKIKHYSFTKETMTFVHQQAPLLNSLVCLLCPPDSVDEAALLDVLNETSLTESIVPFDDKEPNEAILTQSMMPKKAKIRHIPEVKRSHSVDEKNQIGSFLGWETTLERILSLFKINSPLRKFLATRLECFKGLLSWDKFAQECPDEVQDDSSINLRKLAMLPGDSSEISQACSFVLRKLMRHGHIIEGIAFLRNEPLLCNSGIMQSITDLVCSAGLVHETKERDSATQEMMDQSSLIDPLVLIYLHSNKEFATRLVMSSLEVWPVTYCVNILMYINHHLSASSPLSGVVKKKLKQLYVYEKIICMVEIRNGHCSWGHWSHLSYDSKEKRDTILRLLLTLKEFALAREWNEVHHNSNTIIMQIEEEYIYELLEGMEEPDRYTAQSTLEDLPSDSMKQQVCENLLERCFNLESLVLLLRFLLDRLSFQIHSAEKLKQLNNQLLGVKALLCLPHFVQEQYKPLMRRPLLIVEQLLIDLKMEWAGLVMKELSEDEYIAHLDTDDLPVLKRQTISEDSPLSPFQTLIMFYAEKALAFPVPSSREYPSRATSPSAPSTPFTRPYERMRSPSESPSIPPTPRHKKGRTNSFSTIFPQSSEKGKYTRFEPPQHPPRKEDWKTSKSCGVCSASLLGMFSKKHNCRRCGRMVCTQCSSHFMTIEGYTSPQRVCNDCYDHHFVISSSSDDPQASDREDDDCVTSPYLSSQYPWQLLPGDPHYNENLRTEFFYEESPSTTLCMAILDLMSDAKTCANFILHCCHNVSMQLVPDDSGRVNEEIDHYFTINIMETLLLNAKLKLFRVGDSHGVELCDTYLSRVDLLRMLVSSSCSEIPSIQELTKPELSRRVRDRLIAEDHYVLAMEVSTKCQLDTNTVWTAWGMGCIKAGEFAAAREKFRHCFHGGTQLSGGVFLIERIIDQILSCPLASVKNSEDWSDIMKSTLVLLEHKQDNAMIDSQRYEECCYYLKNYGTTAAMISFLARHYFWKDACQYACNKHCSNDVFVEQIWLPALKCGQLENLEEALTSIDHSLNIWEPYLTGVCRFLSQRKLFRILYRVQLFMKDFVRAAMTCIKFFIGFSGHKTTIIDLHGRMNHLETARRHFRAAIEQRGRRTALRFTDDVVPRATTGFSVAELEGHIRTIGLQMKVIDLLHRAAVAANATNKPVPVTSMGDAGVQPSTLFSNGAVRREVASHMLISCQELSEGFPIAIEIISAYRLPSNKVFTEVSKQLAMKECYMDVRVLIQCIQQSHIMSTELNDEVCMAAIKVLANQTKEVRTLDKHLDKLVSLLISDENKVNCLIQCGKLKNAYLVAIKAKLPEEVERIADAAARAGQTGVRDICEKWLRTKS